MILNMHFPMQYRPDDADPDSAPAEVCVTCSDFQAGMLVPVAFCPTAKARCEQYYAWLAGGPKPDWVDEDRWEDGPDAMEFRLPSPPEQPTLF